MYKQTDMWFLLNFLKIHLVYDFILFFNCSELSIGTPEVDDDELMLNVLRCQLTY